MKTAHIAILAIICSLTTISARAESNRDCLLEGTVQKGAQEEVRVKIHNIGKYSDETPCRIRRDRKLKFKLPDDPRVKDAAPGSEVEYRYRTDSNGDTRTELVKIST